MRRGVARTWGVDERKELAAWVEANVARFPDSVCDILSTLQQGDLGAPGDPHTWWKSVHRELQRALRILRSSEKRPSGSPLGALPKGEPGVPQNEREKLEHARDRSHRLRKWHRMLKRRHHRRAKRIEEKLASMPTDEGTQPATLEPIQLNDIELTEEEIAEADAGGDEFVERLSLGAGADPAMKSVNETLMPGGAVLANETRASLPAAVPSDLADATVVKTMTEPRVRYDFSVSVTRIELEVEKKVVVDSDGERYVIAASTREYGPPRYSVTWDALATLAVMVGQFALPFHRLATMLSTAGKRFTAGALSRMLHYVADRLVPIYLELAKQLSDCEVLAGDDTSCRVIEVSAHFAQSKADSASAQEDKPPWADYRTPAAAEESLRLCKETKRARIRRREDGDREARRTVKEDPSLGMIIGRKLAFESPRQDGNGAKQSMNTTVISGRSVADDPRSLIVFYRSHLGGCGNLFESILKSRNPELREVILQGDLSSTNRVNSPELRERFDVRLVGCSAHARRPFANYEHEEPEGCGYMLHLFQGLAMYEQLIDEHGRNRENVLAVRTLDSLELWEEILELAKSMANRWSKATKLGAGARYIIKHFNELTAYLYDPRLEPTNNLRERMLRTEKLIENNSMFRRSLEGRFVLDVVRTVLQTAVAAGVPVHKYLVSVLRTNEHEIAEHPERFTPRAWAAANLDANAPANASTGS